MTVHQLTYNEKRDYLLDILNQSPISYADEYEFEVLWVIESNFQPNEVIPFLIPLETKLDIKNYIDRKDCLSGGRRFHFRHHCRVYS